jgi:hypothetical protein
LWFSFGCIGTIPDGVEGEGRPAAGSSVKNSAKFYFPRKADPCFPRAACGADQESAWVRNKEPKSNFAEILAESYPFRGCPQ